MIKKLMMIFFLLLTICLTSCSADEELISSETVSNEENTADVQVENGSAAGENLNTEDVTQQSDAKEENIFSEDTYWTAYRWFSCETEEDTDFSLPTDIWWIDLWVRADGTAQLRDVHDEVYLINESNMHLTWKIQEDEQLYFYNELYEEPVISGALEEDSLHLQYQGFELYLRQQEKPKNVGKRFIPAELAGTWLMVSGETEGWEWEAMPGHFETLVFSFMWDEYGPGLRADSQYCYYDEIESKYWGSVVTVLDEPLYEGCENAVWSVRIGEESPKDENGYLTETEYYATLLNRNTLLMQQHYTLDGYPELSYQTFQRFPGRNADFDVYDFDIASSCWVCTGYTTADGEELKMLPGLDGMILTLEEEENACWVGTLRTGDPYYTNVEGTWQMGAGGALLLRSEVYGGDDGEGFWYGGAVGGYFTKEAEDEEYSRDCYEIELYYQGGIIHFTRVEAFG